MIHAYKNNGYNIVLDVNSGSVHVVDDVVFDLVRNRFGQRIKALQYRYERDGHKLGGVSVLAGGSRKVSPVLIFGEK